MQTKGALSVVVAGLLFVGNVHSGESAASDKSMVGNGADAVRQSLGELLPGQTLDSVTESAIPGLYEVVVGPRVLYVSGDGRYLLQGSIVDIHTRTNLTEAKEAEAKRAVMSRVADDQMLIFAPEQYTHTMTVFTDIDCGYCRKLHREMSDYNKEGIRVRYLFYPRTGLGSPSYKKAVNVWCSEDRHASLTAAKAGEALESRNCDNPVSDHMQLGEAMGVTGTPAIVLDDGQMVPGYIPAKRMAAFLNNKK